MITPLPQDLLRRIPTGHDFHRWTGTVEHVRTNTASGQSNFLLHPIPGEEDTALNVTNYMCVTDLDIRQLNGQRVVLFGFLFEGQDVTFCFCYSRATDTWLMLHDMHRLLYVFKVKGAKTSAKLFNAFAKTVLGPSSAALCPINPINGKPMSGQEIHGLLIELRSYLQRTMGPDHGNNGPL